MFENTFACEPIISRIKQSSAFSTLRFGKKRKLVSFIFCSVLFFSASAQTASTNSALSGKIVAMENGLKRPLEYATVRLLGATDSILVSGATTNELGYFKLNAISGKDYILFVSCVGYKNLYQPVHIQNNKREHIFSEILLHENSIVLSEATVVGQRSEMVVKTDTVEYNAGSYMLKENAVVEDLLKRLPGITITEDGKILVNGKEVKKVMVDGKDFFRSNLNLSIKNIPADIMDKLQIIDDKSELSKLTGVDDGEENIAINITIQKGKKRGWLVSSNLGGGQELNASTGDIKNVIFDNIKIGDKKITTQNADEFITLMGNTSNFTYK